MLGTSSLPPYQSSSKRIHVKIQIARQWLLFRLSLPDEPHGPLLLTVEPYQDQASGFPVTELDGKVTWIGTLQLDAPEVIVFIGVPWFSAGRGKHSNRTLSFTKTKKLRETDLIKYTLGDAKKNKL